MGYAVPQLDRNITGIILNNIPLNKYVVTSIF